MTDPSNNPGEATNPRAAVGTVTFLFSDIEGSTRLLQSLGAEYARVLTDQRRLLRAAFGENGGREIDTAGDGFFVVFDRARDAIAAAADAQRALAAHEWPDGARVRVRMGIHTGEPVTTSAGELVGLDVHRAARICSVAHGGQVLISAVTSQLATRELPAGLDLLDIGSVSLKDIEQPESVFQLVVDGLESSFPPVAGSRPPRTNLPAQATPLIGREADVDAVSTLLLRDDVRWVTLTGPGGTGKTRLAIEVANRVLPHFGDGAFLVPLASITTTNLLVQTIASTLGLAEKASRPMIDELETFLENRTLLLVLDNFEQIAGAAPTIARLLTRCRTLEVIVTSRVVLHVSAEHEYAVQPLPTPQRVNGSLEGLARVPAVALFVERASAASPGFRLTEANAAAVGRICRQLEGLPLAIELAATRIRLFPPAALADRLADRLNMLKGGSRDLPARHQTLRHALQWSYELLGDADRCMLRRLGVFAGSASLDAIEAVCDPDQGPSFEVLDTLLDHSLIRRITDEDGEPRLTMLDTIREFTREKLAEEADELEATARRHAYWCLERAELAAAHLTGPGLGEWVRRLGADHDNMRAALEWAIAHGQAETGLRLAAALWRFWNAVGFLTEAVDWLRRVLAIPGADAHTALRAQTLQALATITHISSGFAAALPVAEECLQLYRTIGDEEGIATTLNSLGWILAGTGSVDSAIACSKEALERHEALGNRRGTAVALNNLGFAHRQTGDFDVARDYYQRCLDIRREIRDPRGIAYALSNLAYTLQDGGDYQTADRHLDEALETLRGLGDEQLTAWALSHKGRGALDAGDLETAGPLLEESLELWLRVGNATGIAWSGTLLAGLRLAQRDIERAREEALRAHGHWSSAGVLYGQILNHMMLARIEHAAGNDAAALESLAEAERIAGQGGLTHNLTEIEAIRANVRGESRSV